MTTGMSWAELASLLLTIARLSNEATDDITDPEPVEVLYQRMGLRLAGRTDPVMWTALTESVALLDEYISDPVAVELTGEEVHDRVDMALWGLLSDHAPCWSCRSMHYWSGDVPAMVRWEPIGSCSQHSGRAVADPWALAS